MLISQLDLSTIFYCILMTVLSTHIHSCLKCVVEAGMNILRYVTGRQISRRLSVKLSDIGEGNAIYCLALQNRVFARKIFFNLLFLYCCSARKRLAVKKEKSRTFAELAFPFFQLKNHAMKFFSCSHCLMRCFVPQTLMDMMGLEGKYKKKTTTNLESAR